MSHLQFGEKMVRGLERLCATRDVLRRRALVHKALDAQTGDRVLDVGCGPGFYVSELLERVGPDRSVVGVDVSRDMLAVAARRTEGHHNVEFHEGAATTLPLADQSCDRAVSVQVFEYVMTFPPRCMRCGGFCVRVAGSYCGTSTGKRSRGTRSIEI